MASYNKVGHKANALIERLKSNTSQKPGQAPSWFSVTEPHNKQMLVTKRDFQAIFDNGMAQQENMQFDGLQDSQQLTERLDDLQTTFWRAAHCTGERFYFSFIVDNQQRSNWKGFLNSNPFNDNVPNPVAGEPDYDARVEHLQAYRRSVISTLTTVVLHTMCHPEIRTHLIDQCGKRFEEVVEVATLEHWHFIRNELIQMGGIHDLHRTMAIDQQFQDKPISGRLFNPWVAHLKQQAGTLAQAWPATELVMPPEAIGMHRKYSELQVRELVATRRREDLRRIAFSMNIGTTTPPSVIRYLTIKQVGLGPDGNVSFDELESMGDIHEQEVGRRLRQHRRNGKKRSDSSKSKHASSKQVSSFSNSAQSNATTLATTAVTGHKRGSGGYQKGKMWCHECQNDTHWTSDCNRLPVCTKCNKKHTSNFKCGQRKRYNAKRTNTRAVR